MTFREGLARLVAGGQKTQTRCVLSDDPNSRWWREGCKLEVGQRVGVSPGPGEPAIAHVIVEDVSLVRLGAISHDGAVAEGFADVQDFVTAWEQINGSWNPRQRVWLVRFHVERTDEILDAIREDEGERRHREALS